MRADVRGADAADGGGFVKENGAFYWVFRVGVHESDGEKRCV